MVSTKRRNSPKQISSSVKLLMDASKPVTKNELVSIRRDIHTYPEMGFLEHRTSALVQKHLKALGLTIKVMA